MKRREYMISFLKRVKMKAIRKIESKKKIKKNTKRMIIARKTQKTSR
jgi:hypothetical protein